MRKDSDKDIKMALRKKHSTTVVVFERTFMMDANLAPEKAKRANETLSKIQSFPPPFKKPTKFFI